MRWKRTIRRQWLLGAIYALSAAAAVQLTRFDGGVAFSVGIDRDPDRRLAPHADASVD
jgi:hypothetical protein